MKRATARAVVEQLARSDLRGGTRPRKPTSVAIRDGEFAGHHLEYEVRTDKYGVHQGSFGGTAPKGEYTIRASHSGTSATTTIRT